MNTDKILYGMMTYDRLRETRQLFGTSVLNQDFFDMFCGMKIADGSARSVYTMKLMDELVVKIEPGDNSFQNVEEWNRWNDIKYMEDARKWFAPCRSISPNGKILIQERVYRPHEHYEYPKRMPRWFTDLKKSNFGFLEDGSFVCCDYGLSLISDFGCGKVVYRKADWIDIP